MVMLVVVIEMQSSPSFSSQRYIVPLPKILFEVARNMPMTGVGT